jgi:anti-sigma regulatory factor (Ser/Thr protein kinase)
MTIVCDTRTSTRMLLRLSALDLAPLPGAVPSARLHTRLITREWGFPDIADDCELIVSELVTNSVRAARAIITLAGRPPVRLRLAARDAGVQIEVWDASADLPLLVPAAEPDEIGGRGLLLVKTLAARWGVYATEGGGKVVWAETRRTPLP